MTCCITPIKLFVSGRFYFTLTLTLSLLAMYNFASAEAPIANGSSCALTSEEAAGLNGDASTDVHAVSDFSNTAYHLLMAEQYEALDCLADSARGKKEKFPGGMWKLHAIYSGVKKPPLHPTQEDWNNHLKLLERWIAAQPQSVTARIALAQFYVSYGEDARGGGYADTVSQSGWRLLAERVAKAKQILDDAASLPTKDPEWYAAMESVALYQDWDHAASRDLVERAIKFEPTYYYYYRLYANSILPKWGGEEGEADKFMQESADQLGGDAGDILYFRVASFILCGCQNDQHLNLSWARIQKGFEAVEKQYGASMENLNLLARSAIGFNDAVVANKAFDRIGNQWSEELWHGFSYFDSTRQWAKQWAPVMARRRATEEIAAANLRTPEGQHYQSVANEKIQSWVRECLEPSGSGDPGSYELLVRIGKDGGVEDMVSNGASLVSICMSRKLAEFARAKQQVFPPPPQPSYWVRYDLDPKRSASAALK